MEVPSDPVPPEDFLDLNIDIAPLLPESVQPAWAFLQDYPLLLVFIMFAVGWAFSWVGASSCVVIGLAVSAAVLSG